MGVPPRRIKRLARERPARAFLDKVGHRGTRLRVAMHGQPPTQRICLLWWGAQHVPDVWQGTTIHDARAHGVCSIVPRAAMALEHRSNDSDMGNERNACELCASWTTPLH